MWTYLKARWGEATSIWSAAGLSIILAGYLDGKLDRDSALIFGVGAVIALSAAGEERARRERRADRARGGEEDRAADVGSRPRRRGALGLQQHIAGGIAARKRDLERLGPGAHPSCRQLQSSNRRDHRRPVARRRPSAARA